MKNFILDSNPNFSEATAKVGGFTYQLKMSENKGCIVTVYKKEGSVYHPMDEIALSRDDMRAFFMLLCANCKE